MLAWLLLLPALALFTLGLLTVLPSPPWSPWKLAVLAGEFGHWLTLPAGAVLLVAVGPARDGSPIAAAAALLALVATGLLLKPAVQAHRLAATLPGQLAQRFGACARPPPPAFSSARLFTGHDPTPVAPRTFSVDGGLPLDFYPAIGRNGAGPAPIVIVIHGGGWDSGDRHQLPKLNDLLAARGFAVAAISYRLAPQSLWPAQRDDTLAAIAWLKAQAPALGVDAQRLVLLGRSAGGQIAQTVAYTARDPAIRGVVALYAPSDLIFGYENTHEDDMLRSPALMRQFLGGSPQSARANYESASALFHVHPAAPPTLLLHGVNDALAWHRHSARLAARLAEAGVPHCYVALPWATHAFDFNLHGPGGQLTVFALEWFLERVTTRD
jgi:acetyl esterase/lipase